MVGNYSEPEVRTCEYCGCHTNARVRRCCENGRAADVAAAVERVAEDNAELLRKLAEHDRGDE